MGNDMQTLGEVSANKLIYIKEEDGSVFLVIETPHLIIRSVQEKDISFYQSMWANRQVMENFAEGQPRLYSGTPEEKAEKFSRNVEPDYAKWRVGGWCQRLAEGNPWSGMTVLLKDPRGSVSQKIGHVVIGGGELAYFLLPQYWNKGYGSEAVTALVRVAVPELVLRHGINALPIINATVRKDHIASQRVLENAGLCINKKEIDFKIFCGTAFERWNAYASVYDLCRDYLFAYKENTVSSIQEEETLLRHFIEEEEKSGWKDILRFRLERTPIKEGLMAVSRVESSVELTSP
jgi:RimJ/RimL family protein N-acetyltransferase